MKSNSLAFPKSNSISPKHKLESIQILRGIAVTAVVFVHVGMSMLHFGNYHHSFLAYTNLPNLGNSGVDIFFVISGFINVLYTNR